MNDVHNFLFNYGSIVKILYLHQYFATPKSKAGTRSYEMAKRFVAAGHEVTFVTTSAGLIDNYSFKSGWNELIIDGIKLHVLDLPYSNKDSFLKRIFKFIHFSFSSTFKSLSVTADVVFATSTPLTIAIPGLFYSKIKKKPMVFEVRDLWPELPIAIGAIKNPLIIFFAEYLEKLAYKQSSHIVGLSPGMCDGVIKHGIDKKDVTLATNSCDTELFDVEAEIGVVYKREKLSFVGDRKLVAYTGTFGAINDVKYLVDLAVESNKQELDICFIAIGDGSEKEDIINYATTCGVLNSNFFVLEPVPKYEIVKLLSATDLSLSLFGPVKEMWNNSANKLFDALASSTPIAINYGGWQRDFIIESKCGIVLDSNNMTKAVDGIKTFLNSNEDYSVAVKSCRHLAYHVYSRDIMAARIESALSSVIK